MVSRMGNEGLVLIDYAAETRSKIEPNVPKVIACLGDSDSDVRKSALDAIGKLVEYGE
jgi:hypothetical protein